MSRVIRKIKGRVGRLLSLGLSFRLRSRFLQVKSFSDVFQEFADETRRYDFFRWFFKRKLPKRFVYHRNYFSSNARGFGEDPFHAMWFLLFKEYRPQKILEIGVYRGQTLSLFALLAEYFDLESEVVGISPLNEESDSVSSYIKIDYEADIESNFQKFGLTPPRLARALSTSNLGKRTIRRAAGWDLVYVDGSHDYEVVQSDIDTLAEALIPGGLLVMDDCSLFAPFRPPSGSFAGHPGPSAVVNGLRFRARFREIGTCGHNRVYVRI